MTRSHLLLPRTTKPEGSTLFLDFGATEAIRLIERSASSWAKVMLMKENGKVRKIAFVGDHFGIVRRQSRGAPEILSAWYVDRS
jgi:hypothetical protein